MYAVGDLVYHLDTATLKGKSRKLHAYWKGPGVIVECLSPSLYRVQLEKCIVTALHDRLKKYLDRDPPRWVVRLRDRTVNNNPADIVTQYSEDILSTESARRTSAPVLMSRTRCR